MNLLTQVTHSDYSKSKVGEIEIDKPNKYLLFVSEGGRWWLAQSPNIKKILGFKSTGMKSSCSSLVYMGSLRVLWPP